MLYAGDIQSAKEEVNAMIRFLGFTPVDRGSLRNAREIEDVPVQRFPNWKNPLIISCLVFGMYNQTFINISFIFRSKSIYILATKSLANYYCNITGILLDMLEDVCKILSTVCPLIIMCYQKESHSFLFW